MTASTDSQTAGTRRPKVASVPGRSGTRLIDAMWAGSVLIAVACAVLTGLTWSDYQANDGISQVGSSVSTVAYATLGALIVRRVRNPIGWLWLTAGVSTGLMGLFSAYALLGMARKTAVPVTIEVEGIERYPQDVEATVYFCALEALQNIAKYAGASRAAVRLSCSGENLQFTVSDDGTGFDTAAARDGTGLQGMADRLAALGGTLHLRSQPGHGTTVSGRLPVPES